MHLSITSIVLTTSLVIALVSAQTSAPGEPPVHEPLGKVTPAKDAQDIEANLLTLGNIESDLKKVFGSAMLLIIDQSPARHRKIFHAYVGLLDALEPDVGSPAATYSRKKLHDTFITCFGSSLHSLGTRVDLNEEGILPLERLGRLALVAGHEGAPQELNDMLDKWYEWSKTISFVPSATTKADKLAEYVGARLSGEISDLPAITKFEAEFEAAFQQSQTYTQSKFYQTESYLSSG